MSWSGNSGRQRRVRIIVVSSRIDGWLYGRGAAVGAIGVVIIRVRWSSSRGYAGSSTIVVIVGLAAGRFCRRQCCRRNRR